MSLKNTAYVVMMRAIWHYAGSYRKSYTLGLALMTAAYALWLLAPYLNGQIFNTIQTGLDSQEKINHVLLLLFLWFMLKPLGWALHGPGRILERRLGFFAQQSFVQDMYSKLQKVPFAWHQNFHSGQLFDRIRKAEAAIDSVASNQFRYISLAMNFIGPIVAVVFLFPIFALACLAFTVVFFVAIRYFDRELVPLFKEGNKLSHEYAGVFNDYMANIRTIITLRLGKPTKDELFQRYNLRQKPYWRSVTVNEWKWSSLDILMDMMVAVLVAAAILGYGGDSEMKLGNLIMLIQYLGRFSNAFSNLGQLYQEIVRAAADYTSCDVIEDAYQHYHITDKSSDHVINKWNTLRIENLSFAYEDVQDRPRALNNISFDIGPHEKIALIGHSGSGKSTLMTVLRGLYHADSGRSIVDGKDYSLDVLSGLTTLIPQDPEIFENTIRYNITFGIEHTEGEIMASCKLAGFDKVLARLPQGLESDIREKGVNLSGGQKQRLALARGVFAIQQSSLILLDEPTSSVDTLTEMKIFDRLFKEFADKAIIASVHRLHLLPRFDRIIVLDDGKIVEEGGFQDLLSKNGALVQIWTEYQNEQAHGPHKAK